MKLNLIEWFKNKKLKKKINKINEKIKNIIFVKKKYFARNYQLINVKNQRKFNVLQIILVKKSLKKRRNWIEFFKKYHERKILLNLKYQWVATNFERNCIKQNIYQHEKN